MKPSLRWPLALTLAVMSCGMIAARAEVGADSNPRQTPEQTWVPFKGKLTSHDGASGVTREGTYARHSNGSTRRVLLPSGAAPGQITITNVPARLIHRQDGKGVWTTTPLQATPRVQTLEGYMRPGVSSADTTFEGKKALRLTRDAESYQIIVPQLNYFSVEQKSGQRTDRVFEIVIAEQPDADFVLPKTLLKTH